MTQFLLRSGGACGTLLPVAIIPLTVSIPLIDTRTRAALSASSARAHAALSAVAAAPAGSGALAMIARYRDLAAVAVVAMLTNCVITNGDNLLSVSSGLHSQVATRGIAERGGSSLLRQETTAFYGEFFFWINLAALLAQAFRPRAPALRGHRSGAPPPAAHPAFPRRWRFSPCSLWSAC
jgi:AAA family ATP:ADP antiporter